MKKQVIKILEEWNGEPVEEVADEVQKQMCQACTYKQEHNERVLATPKRCIITRSKR